MPKYNSIRVNQSAKTQIKMLSSRLGKTEYDYANRMITFISETGMDIFSDSLPSIPDLIKNHDNRMISFLKKREKDFFVPMNNSFLQMIELHTRTFASLETLDVINYSTDSNKLKTPIVKDNPLKSTEKSEENEVKNENDNSIENVTENRTDFNAFSSDEKEELLIQLDRERKEKKTYEEELSFLLKNLKENKSLSGPKYVCNIYTKDYLRIKNLVSDN